MDFFGYQDQARRNTALLIALFSIAVVLIVLAVYVAVWTGLFVGQMFAGNSGLHLSSRSFWDIELFLWVTGITVLVIAGGSLYKVYQLAQGGGAAVAEMLGGKRLDSGGGDPLHRRLLNVVEEMAIASGLPVPPVYLLDQDGINAFAAGFTPGDIVIGVTSGATELLTRDELQGVIAHEFSHILNGDTRMKMRLMGVLHGVTLVSDAGIALMTMRRVRYHSRRNQGGMHPAMLVIGFLLFMVGTIGLVFADLIKRAVSRQREFLADAAAVQFTRNPLGIAGALKTIGGYKEGSHIRHAGVQQASHFFFGNAIKAWFAADWWATHPPLIDRIRRIEPGFRGRIEAVNPQARMVTNIATAAAGFAGGDGTTVAAPAANAESIMARIGQPDAVHLEMAGYLIADMPARLREFAHEPFTARAAIYALLLDRDAGQRKIQLQVLQKSADPNVFRETLDIQPLIGKLKPALRLPLIDLVVPALKTLSPQQYVDFRKNMGLLIKADHKVSMFEYVLHRVLLSALQGAFGRPEQGEARHHSLAGVIGHCACLVARLAREAYGTGAEKPYRQAMATLAGGEKMPMPDLRACRLSHVDAAIRELRHAVPSVKHDVIKACVCCVLYNEHVSVEELELLRAIAAGIDCPIPPLVVN